MQLPQLQDEGLLNDVLRQFFLSRVDVLLPIMPEGGGRGGTLDATIAKVRNTFDFPNNSSLKCIHKRPTCFDTAYDSATLSMMALTLTRPIQEQLWTNAREV